MTQEVTHRCYQCGSSRVWITQLDLTKEEVALPSIFHFGNEDESRLQIIEKPSARIWCLACWRKHKETT